MANEIENDDSLNVTEEEVISEIEETLKEEKAPTKKVEQPKVEHTDKERRLYERAKKAETEARERAKELEEFKKNYSKNSFEDVDAILEVQRATMGLDQKEVGELKVRANALGVPLSEARENEDFKLWQMSYQDKVAKEKAPVPSTTQPGEGRPRTEAEILDENRGTFEDFISESPEKTKVLEKSGLWKDPQRRKDTIPLSNG